MLTAAARFARPLDDDESRGLLGRVVVQRHERRAWGRAYDRARHLGVTRAILRADAAVRALRGEWWALSPAERQMELFSHDALAARRRTA